MVKRYLLLFLSITLIFVSPIILAKNSFAISKADLKFYANNNIMFIDDKDSVSENCLDGDLVDLGDNSNTALNYLLQKAHQFLFLIF